MVIPRQLKFEKLEARRPLSATSVMPGDFVDPAAFLARQTMGMGAEGEESTSDLTTASAALVQQQTLEVPAGMEPAQAELQIENSSSDTVSFRLQVNGQLWVNRQHLAETIRHLPADYPGESLYRKAYRFVAEHVRADYMLSITETNWHREPTLFLNSIGFGFCGDVATALALVWGELGYETRVWRLSGHTVPEVFADGKWQMFDAHLRIYYHTRDGRVASVSELARDSLLILAPIRPIQSPDGRSFNVYSQRMASIYRTTDDNYLCDECFPRGETAASDLVFSLPPGAALAIGGRYSDRVLKIYDGRQTAWKYGQLKLTIPAGWSGRVDLPLVLIDVRGSSPDAIAAGGQILPVGSEQLFQQLQQSLRDGPTPLAISNNQQVMELVFLLNPQIASLQRVNQIDIQYQHAGSRLEARLQGQQQAAQQFAWDFRTPLDAADPGDQVAMDLSGNGCHARVRHTDLRHADGLEFATRRNQFVDISTISGGQLFRDGNSFTLEAWLQLNANDDFRRPVIDATRFSLLVDQEGHLQAYFRSGDGPYVVQRVRTPQPLSGGQQHHVAAVFQDLGPRQLLQLFLDGQLVASGDVSPIANTYPVRGPYVGMRERPGSSEFFSGLIAQVQISMRAKSANELLAEWQAGVLPTASPAAIGAPGLSAKEVVGAAVGRALDAWDPQRRRLGIQRFRP